MHIPALSPNILIIASIVGGAVYGLVAGKHRLRTLILSVYVGIVLATQLAAVVVSATHQQVDIVTLGLFLAPIVVFGFSGGGHGAKHHSQGSVIANLLVGLATGALIAASALKLLPPSEAARIAGDSFIGTELMMFQLWLIGLLPLAALMFGLMKSKEKH